MGFVAPLGEFVHEPGDKFRLSCNTKPVVEGAHEIVACFAAAGAIVRVGNSYTTDTLSKKRDWLPVPDEVPTRLIRVEEDVAVKLKLKLVHCIPVPEGVNVSDLLELPADTKTVFDPFPNASF